MGRDGGVALDELGHHPALGLDAERQRGHVQEQDVLDLALEHAGLEGGADGHDLVGVDPLWGLALGELLDELDHHGHPGRAADQHHVVDVGQAFWVLAFQSVTALSKGTRSRSTRSEVIRLSSPRVRRCSMWSGPSGVAVMKAG